MKRLSPELLFDTKYDTDSLNRFIAAVSVRWSCSAGITNDGETRGSIQQNISRISDFYFGTEASIFRQKQGSTVIISPARVAGCPHISDLFHVCNHKNVGEGSDLY